MDDNKCLPDADILENLKKSHSILRGVMESPKDVVIFALDRQYRYTAFNRNHHRTMQQIWGVDISLGKNMLGYIGNAADRLKARQNFDRALSGESFSLVETYGDTALARRYYENTYSPIIDENGEIIGLALFLTDITLRKQAEAQLQQRIALERIISGILSDLVRTDDENLDGTINGALEKIGSFTGADRAYVFQFKDDARQVDNTHEWCGDGIAPQMKNRRNITLDDEQPWFAARIRNLDTVHIPDVSVLPAEAGPEQAFFISQGIRSLMVVPTRTGDELKGFLGFDAVRKHRTWTETEEDILRSIGETICIVLERRQLIADLKAALSQVKQLSGLLPICSYCKRIRDDKGYWNRIESYIQAHSEAEFSHSLCRECAEKYYPDLYESEE